MDSLGVRLGRIVELTRTRGIVYWRHQRAQWEYEARSRYWICLGEYSSFVINQFKHWSTCTDSVVWPVPYACAFFCSCQLATVVAWHVSLKRSHFWHPIQTVVIWPITFKLATSLAYLFFLRRYQAIVAMATKHTKPTTTARAIKTDLWVEEDFCDLSELRPEVSGDAEMISFSPIKTMLIPICCSISGATFISSCFIISRGIMLLLASVGILTTSFTLKSSMSFQVFGYPCSMMISSGWKVRAFFWLCVSGFLMEERSRMVY